MKIKINIPYLASAIVLICILNISAQQTAQVSIPFEVYDNAGGQKTLYFGLDQTATDSIDHLLGESDLPPFPPVGAFDARFILPKNGFNGSLSSWSDYRFAAAFPFSGTIEHRLKYQSAQGATIMYFSWNLPPEVTGLLQDLATGTIVNVPISGSGVYELTNFVVLNQLRLTINYNNIIAFIEEEDTKPKTYILEQNYPNPFNPSTTIQYFISKESNVTLKVFDLLGEEVTTLVNEVKSRGAYSVNFYSAVLASGVYYYQIQAGGFIETKKMVLIR